MANKKPSYSEPKGYFPKEIQKKYGLGEYATKQTKKSVKKPKRK